MTTKTVDIEVFLAQIMDVLGTIALTGWSEWSAHAAAGEW